ncbi:MAG: Tim44/TimA family putative adaptor protein [Hyphomicrobiaceae bacterium]
MDGKIDILTLVFLVLAVVIVLKLRSVLGQRTGDDEARKERYKEQARAAAAEARDKVVALPRRDRVPADATMEPSKPTAPSLEDARKRLRDFAAGNEDVGNGLLAIHDRDRDFNPEHFMAGARQAYEMIVTAFAEGNRKLLRNLLGKDVYEGFDSAIRDRESRGEQIDQSFIGINKAEVVEAEMRRDMAQISVRFVSELISATRDRTGEVLAGDPKRVKEVMDIWTFARDVTSRDPNWKLVATQPPG